MLGHVGSLRLSIMDRHSGCFGVGTHRSIGPRTSFTMAPPGAIPVSSSFEHGGQCPLLGTPPRLCGQSIYTVLICRAIDQKFDPGWMAEHSSL